ncbi:MAG TPA: hypothetical protein VIS99_13960 [Terrimicrobiaceae bacterium]
MAAIPPRLKTQVDSQPQPRQDTDFRTEATFQADSGGNARAADIPIFCAGGCGEVMGFLTKKNQPVPTLRCHACEAREIAKKASLAPAEGLPANTDELATLRSPPRDLRKIHILQVLAVILIFVGSIYIAMGRPVGIYLAAFGTLTWIAIAWFRWKLSDRVRLGSLSNKR